MKRFFLFFLSGCCLLCISGCLAATPVDEYGYVLSIGIDAGQEKRYAYSFLLQKDTGTDGGASDNEGQGYTLNAEGDTIYEALETLSAGIPYILNFKRTRFIAFCEEIAMGEGIVDFMALHLSALKMRPSLKFVVVEGSALEFYEKLQAENNPNLAKLQASLMQNQRVIGIVPITNYTIFAEALSSGRFDPVLTLCSVDKAAEENAGEQQQPTAGTTGGATRRGGMGAYAMGAALFDGRRMVGKLTGEQTKYLLLATGEFDNGSISFDYEGQLLSIQLGIDRAPRTELELSPAIQANVKLYLDCEISVDPDWNIEESWEDGLQAALEGHIEAELQSVFQLCKSLNCDAFGFGKAAVKKFSSINAWEAYNWKGRYGELEASFTVNISLNDAYVRGWLE